MIVKRTAPPMWGSIIGVRASMPVSAIVASGNCERTIVSMLLHGHTFTREPMMKLARTIRVSRFQRARSQWRNFEKARIPMRAPAIRTAIDQNDVQKMPASAPSEPQSAPRFAMTPVMHAIMYWYLPRINRIKLPEMPGRIIAQIASAPLMKMNQRPSGVWVGERVQMTTPSTMPSAAKRPSRTFQPLIPFRMKTDEATIRPKKKAQVWIG